MEINSAPPSSDASTASSKYATFPRDTPPTLHSRPSLPPRREVCTYQDDIQAVPGQRSNPHRRKRDNVSSIYTQSGGDAAFLESDLPQSFSGDDNDDMPESDDHYRDGDDVQPVPHGRCSPCVRRKVNPKEQVDINEATKVPDFQAPVSPTQDGEKCDDDAFQMPPMPRSPESEARKNGFAKKTEQFSESLVTHQGSVKKDSKHYEKVDFMLSNLQKRFVNVLCNGLFTREICTL